ncbi:MAG: tyrosine--tRNA ligase [Chitinophagaceae bacterium]|nr:tyrosine--tRNA ligase [Chitinophagaceae bacterium]
MTEIQMNLIDELTWRGMIQDIIPGTREQLNKEMTTGYIGFDPTADSLHIGSLVPILLLVHLQKAGHKPIALIGGATGMIGDPSGKSEERILLSKDVLEKNVQGIQKQLERFLDFSASLDNKAELVNNYDWFQHITFIDFLRDTGKLLTVSYMMSKESVKKRIESETGLSYTEFAYQIMQGYDFLWLYENKNCKLQMGGSDQWGNITAGTELIRKKLGKEAFAFTCPLITKADGGKFGKTEKGNVWLDPQRTSPYQFYQFWINSGDEDAAKWIKIFTFLTKDEIEEIIHKHNEKPSERLLQKKLAEEVTRFVHGEDALREAQETTEKLFSRKTVPAEMLTVEELENMDGVSKKEFSFEKIQSGTDIVTFLHETGICTSKGEARKLIQNGGAGINRKKIENPSLNLDAGWLLHKKYILVQKGKKNYYLVTVK